MVVLSTGIVFIKTCKVLWVDLLWNIINLKMVALSVCLLFY